MSTLPRARIRIAADLFQFDNFADILRSDISGYIPKLRAGDDVQFEIALFNNGELVTDLSGISTLHLEIKPLHAEAQPDFNLDDYEDYDLRGPAADVSPIREKTITTADLNDALTLIDWETLDPDEAHATITLDASETHLAPGDRWLTLAVTTTDTPAQTRTIAAGRIRILGGGRNQGQPAAATSDSFYSATQSDARFLQRLSNLSDLDSPEDARGNLGLGTSALLDSIDEDDFASQSDTHLPTQQSVKAYVDYETLLTFVRHTRYSFSSANATTQVASGSGSYSTANGISDRVQAGATAGSSAYKLWGTSQSNMGPLGHGYVQPFTERGILAFNIAHPFQTTDGHSYIFYGKGYGASNAAPSASEHLVGFQTDGNALFGIAANGSSMDKVDLSTTLPGTPCRLAVEWDGSGNVSFISIATGGDMTVLGTSSYGSTLGTNAACFMIGVENGGDSANQMIDIAAAEVIFP